MVIRPECRYCGERVIHFGDLCDACDAENGERDDWLLQLARDDADRMRP